MKRMSILYLALLALALAITRLSVPAHADDQTITLAVDKMYCATCPLTVQTAIQRVPGVKSVKVDYRTKAAVVMFDATKTTPDVIAAASTNVGYPARVTQTGS